MTVSDLRGITSLCECDRVRLRRKVVRIGLQCLADARGPMPLWKFTQNLAITAGARMPIDIGQLSDALTWLMWSGNDERLRIVATSMPGAGWVFDRDNPETWPYVGR